jgi:2,5-diamino-6-(ribosylamino)-4(3H)-pyrimidinone 5'-phosphate reductase
MVGIRTVLADNPSLTIKGEECREHRKKRGADVHPARIVVDSAARTPTDAKILHKEEGKRIVAVSEAADPARVAALRPFATVVVAGSVEVDLPRLLNKLSEMGIQRLMVEGGGTLIEGLIRADLVDEIYSYIGNIIIGGKDAPTLADGEGFVQESDFGRLTLLEARKMENGVLLHWQVTRP